jgi:PAB-dependent poly(A)-specific ribonuclease subunit 2
MERGCIWVGHGLSQDFLTANLYVPPTNVIDTVELYHLPQLRHISLRYLANYVLKRDMQEEVHDSVQDAKAAFELYQRALEMNLGGTFDKFLNQLYDVGQRNDWKIVQIH